MTRVYSPQEVSAVMSLSAAQRLDHFIKQVADAQRFFLVKRHGQTLAFHAQEHAAVAGFSPATLEEVDLYEALQREWAGATVFVLPTAIDAGTELPIQALMSRIRDEIEEYY